MAYKVINTIFFTYMKEIIKYLVLIIFVFLVYSCKEKGAKQIEKAIVDVPKNHATEKKKVVIDYDIKKWTEIDSSIIMLDLRYATTNNFVKKKMYKCARCFLRPEVANKIITIDKMLRKQGFRLKLFDCYRPRPIQQELWNIKPDARYVTPPKRGSMHNRGLAIDLTITDLKGNELDMGTGFDYFGVKAYQTTTNLPDKVLQNRQLLRSTLENHGFKAIRTEWWHYSYTQKRYPLSDWIWNCE